MVKVNMSLFILINQPTSPHRAQKTAKIKAKKKKISIRKTSRSILMQQLKQKVDTGRAERSRAECSPTRVIKPLFVISCFIYFFTEGGFNFLP